MPSLLEKLWGFYLNEHSGELEPEEFKTLNEVMDAEILLLATMSDEQKALYKDYNSKVTDHQATVELNAFRRGVQLGVQFMTEAYGKKG